MDRKSLELIEASQFNHTFNEEEKNRAIESLENGKVLYFPHLPFLLSKEEKSFLDPAKTDPKTKNISYDAKGDRVGGAVCEEKEKECLKKMMLRYRKESRTLLDSLLSHYKLSIVEGRTSFRPVEIKGRKSPSYRKDDTRLHVDSFPSSPVRGRRILRVFTNVNPHGAARVWRVGEPFENVVEKMLPRTTRPLPGMGTLLKWLKITKERRSFYDHYMLQIHNLMKGDMEYQKNVEQEEIHFPSGSTWIVYTDQVSHAAMEGQYVFEQTYYVPVSGLKNQRTAPLAVLERKLDKVLL